MSRRAPLRAAPLLALLLAGDATVTGRQAPGPLGGLGANPDPVLRALAPLDPEVSPAGWLRLHPADSLTTVDAYPVHPLLETREVPCAVATGSWQDALGRRVVRAAYFYPPEPAVLLQPLPPRADRELPRSQCRLGAIRVLVHTRHENFPEIVDSLHGGLRRTIGAEADSGRGSRHYWGSASWSRPARWRSGPATVVVAFDTTASRPDPPAAFAIAHLPTSRLGTAFAETLRETWAAHPSRDTALTVGVFRTAVAMTGLPADRGAALLAIVERTGRQDNPPMDDPSDDAALITALSRWLPATDTLPPQRGAAALLAADRAVRLAAPVISPPDSGRGPAATVGALTGLGARFVFAALGGVYVYARNWVREARDLDSTGPAGELALMVLVEEGFPHPTCGDGAVVFRRVISEGEPLLDRLRDPERRLRVHLSVGDADRDIVALASGISEYAELAAYRGESAAARQRAVSHYRAAIALQAQHAVEPLALRTRAAWREGWRLLAGLAPTGLRFHCVYD